MFTSCCFFFEAYKHDYLPLRYSRVTTVSALKKIGYIGLVPECSTGNKYPFLHHILTPKTFKLHIKYWTNILLSFLLTYIYIYTYITMLRPNFRCVCGDNRFWRYLPRSVGMRRIALHKSVSAKGDKMYLLVCECADLLKDISAAAVLIPALRARLCGYTGLYRPIQAF